jgi:hypothetical protein
MKVGTVVGGIEQNQKAVEHIDPMQAKLLVGLVRLMIPVSAPVDCDATGRPAATHHDEWH